MQTLTTVAAMSKAQADLETGAAAEQDAAVRAASPADLEIGAAAEKKAAVRAASPADLEFGAVAEKEDAEVRASRALTKEALKKVAEEEDPRLRWAFVRKVYGILALQFALTSAIATVACFVHPIPRFFEAGSVASWAVYIAILLAPLLMMWPMLAYRQKHPVNLLLLGFFTLCISLSVAVSASTFVGRVVLQAAILTAVAVISLTLFTFWAAKRGYNFTFMFPFLFASLLVLIVYLAIQIFFPLGRVGMTVYGCIATLVFSGFIVYDTNLLIKRYTYNEYIIAAISLYLDVINLFMAQLSFSTFH